jgi:hypothetical protein
MAHKTPIARWMLNNRDRVNPSFVKYEWPSRYFSGVADFSSTISVDGIEASGRGIDIDQDLALEKSAAESIERYICRSLNIDSVGLAVSGEAGAEGHAKREALERYFFGKHQRAKIPFVKVVDGSAEFEATRKIREEFERRNGSVGQLSFFRMAVSLPFHGYVVIISSEGFAICLGLALNVDARRASLSAFFEAMSCFARFRDDPIQFEIERKANSDYWNCDPRFLSELNTLFKSATSAASPIPTPRLVPVALDISGIDILRDCPISPVKFLAEEILP